MDKHVLLLSLASLVIRGVASVIQILGGIQQSSWSFAPALWDDYYSFYIPQLKQMTLGMLPYLNLRVGNPPLFLYSMLPLYVLGGPHVAQLPIVLADGLTAPLIYLIAKPRLGKPLAAIAGLTYALLPLAVVNEGYLWLSSQPMTFFIILSIYLLGRDRASLSSASLAVAVMFKQEALVVAIPLFLWQFSKSKKRTLPSLALFGGIVLAISLPFLVIAPHNYVNFMSYQIISVGAPEQGGGRAFFSNIDSSSLAVSSCRETTIRGFFTGAACGSFINTNQLFWDLVVSQINTAGSFLVPIFFILFALTLYSIRLSPSTLELACAYSLIGFLILFSNLAHSPFSYYMIPVYAILLTVPTDKPTLIVSVASAVASILVPDGSLLLILPLFVVLALTIAMNVKLERRGRLVEPNANTSREQPRVAR